MKRWRRKVLRLRILATLDAGRPAPVHPKVLQDVLNAVDLHPTAEQVEEELAKLIRRGLVVVDAAGRAALTIAGQDRVAAT